MSFTRGSDDLMGPVWPEPMPKLPREFLKNDGNRCTQETWAAVHETPTTTPSTPTTPTTPTTPKGSPSLKRKPTLRLRLSKSNGNLREQQRPKETMPPLPPLPVTPPSSVVPSVASPSVATTVVGGKENGNLLSRKFAFWKDSRRNNQQSQTSDLPPRVDFPRVSRLDPGLADWRVFGSSSSSQRSSHSSTGSSANSSAKSPIGSGTDESVDNFAATMTVKDRLLPKAKELTTHDNKMKERPPRRTNAYPARLPKGPNQYRIEELEMHRDNLASRKAKVGTLLHELTQVVQPSPVSYDIAMRNEVKKAAAALNDELAEIQKEEYDVGLQLVRAWRRRDERDLYGSDSSLWVRRVTT